MARVSSRSAKTPWTTTRSSRPWTACRYRERLPALERHLATAYYYNVVDYDRAKVEDAYRSALDLDPDNGVAANNLAFLYNDMRRFAEAESLTRPQLSVGGLTIYLNATRALMGQGKLDSAGAVVDRFDHKTPVPGRPINVLLHAWLAEG